MTHKQQPLTQQTPFLKRHRILVILVATGIFVSSWFYAPHVNEGPILCVSRGLTGIPCPSCGFTRAFCQIIHGDFLAAAKLNILAYPAFLLFMVALPTAIVELILQRRLKFYRFMYSCRLGYLCGIITISYSVARMVCWAWNGQLYSEYISTSWSFRIMKWILKFFVVLGLVVPVAGVAQGEGSEDTFLSIFEANRVKQGEGGALISGSGNSMVYDGEDIHMEKPRAGAKPQQVITTEKDGTQRVYDGRDTHMGKPRAGVVPRRVVVTDKDGARRVYDGNDTHSGKPRAGVVPRQVIVRDGDKYQRSYSEKDIYMGRPKAGAQPASVAVTDNNGVTQIFAGKDTYMGKPRAGAKPQQVIVTGRDGVRSVYRGDDVYMGKPRAGARPIQVIKP